MIFFIEKKITYIFLKKHFFLKKIVFFLKKNVFLEKFRKILRELDSWYPFKEDQEFCGPGSPPKWYIGGLRVTASFYGLRECFVIKNIAFV
mgnify:CR=1 FL=1